MVVLNFADIPRRQQFSLSAAVFGVTVLMSLWVSCAIIKKNKVIQGIRVKISWSQLSGVQWSLMAE